jgi:hypothetical protein
MSGNSPQQIHHTGENRCPWERWVPAFRPDLVRGLKARGTTGIRNRVAFTQGC